MAKLASSSFALDFLRRLLCAHTAGDAAARQCDGAAAERPSQEPEPEGRSPCIVARLMGLDTMPPPDQQRPLRRSMSASSMEGRPSPPCLGAAPQPQPRALRPSASFREKPTYLREENDEFLLLSFSPEEGHGGGDGDLCLAASRSDADGAENGGRGKRRDRAKKPSRGRRKLQYCADEDAESASRRSSSAAAAAAEYGLQNSSPVSVLEARDGQESSSTTTSSSSLEEAEPGSPRSEEIQHQLNQQCCSRRKLQIDFDGARSICHGSGCRCSDMERRRRRIVNKAEAITPDVSGIWQLICRLVQEDLNNTSWVASDDAGIAAKMESLILDQLICEAIDELMQLLSD